MVWSPVHKGTDDPWLAGPRLSASCSSPRGWVPTPNCRARARAAPRRGVSRPLRGAPSQSVGELGAAEVTAGRRGGGSMAASLWLRGAASGLRYWSRRQRPAVASLAVGKDLAPSPPVPPLAARFSRRDGRRGVFTGGAAVGSGLETPNFGWSQGLLSLRQPLAQLVLPPTTFPRDPDEWRSASFPRLKGWEELRIREENLVPGRAFLELGPRGQLEGPIPRATRHLPLRLLGLTALADLSTPPWVLPGWLALGLRGLIFV